MICGNGGKIHFSVERNDHWVVFGRRSASVIELVSSIQVHNTRIVQFIFRLSSNVFFSVFWAASNFTMVLLGTC